MTFGQKTITFAASLALMASFIATPVLAASSFQSGLDKAAPAELKAGEPDLSVIIGNIISGVMSLVGALLLVYLLYGGFIYMTAGGDETKVKNAVSIIKNAVIGIVIIALSYAIATFVVGQLGSATQKAPTTTEGTPPPSG